MTRHIARRFAAVLGILGVAGGLGWKVAHHPETAASLQDVRLIPHSEHASPGPSGALAGIRIRLSPGGFDEQVLATAREVPRIPVAPE